MDSGQRTASVVAGAALLVAAWFFLRWNDRAIDEAFPTLSPPASESHPLREAVEVPVREAVAGAPAPPAVEPLSTMKVQSTSEAPAHTATLEILVERDGLPAPGVWVWVASPDDWPMLDCLDLEGSLPVSARFERTDASGLATFHELVPWIHTVGLDTAQPPANPWPRRFVMSGLHAGYRHVIALGSAVVRGTVYYHNGQPRGGAGVQVVNEQPDAHHLVIAAIARTDAHGEYRIEDLPAAAWLVLMDDDGRFDGRGLVERARVETVSGGEHVVDFGTPRGLPLWSGRVLNAFGEPFPGTGQLQLLQELTGAARMGPIDDHGHFMLAFSAGTFDLAVHVTGSPGGGFELSPVELPAHDLERDVVVPGARLAGRVVAADGAATSLADLRVSAREKGHDYPAAFRTVTTGADGTFRLDGLAPGTWVVGIYPGRLVEGQTIEVTLAPSERVVELELRWTHD